MSRWALVVAVLLATPVLVGCTDPGEPSVENPIEPCGELTSTFEPEEAHNPRLRMETTNGTFTVLVYGHQVPFTASHVQRVVSQGTYEDTRFHYIFPNQAIFGGDPRSASGDKNAWGTGGYNLDTVDEHHQFLRHEEAGIVSLVSPKPNGAGSQFLVTLAPQPGFDDRHPVFGKVIEGMDTVQRIAQTPTDDRNRPVRGAHLENVTWVDPPEPISPPPAMSAYGFDCTELAEPGDEAEFLVAVRNTGQSIFNGTLSTSLEDDSGWSVELTNAERIVISSGQTVAYGLNVTVPGDAEMGSEHTFEVNVTESRGDASATLELTTKVGRLGQPALERQQIELRYIGVLDDARAFETTETTYVDDPSVSWFKQEPPDPSPVTLTPSSETLNRSQPGQLVERARLGETVVGFIPPGQAYGTQDYGENDLGGRLLVFQVHVTASD